ncbi:MAG: O-methyltransferase [Streptosporangiaceae bacterium]
MGVPGGTGRAERTGGHARPRIATGFAPSPRKRPRVSAGRRGSSVDAGPLRLLPPPCRSRAGDALLYHRPIRAACKLPLIERWGPTPREPGSPIRAVSEEAAISSHEASWAYSERFLPEDDALVDARARSEDVVAPPISPGSGAALRFLAALVGARAVVEVGSGVGVSGVWLLRGMRPDGMLTSVDVEPEHQRLAKQAYTEAGFSHTRIRLITGRALDVLPRLTDGGYDLVFCDAAKHEYAEYLSEAMRLLHLGGVMAFDNALWHGQVADPARRDPDTVAVRELGKVVRDDERLVPLLLPVGDGLLAAVKRG